MRWLFGDGQRLLSFDLQSDDAAIEARQGFINDSHQGHGGHDIRQPTPLAPRLNANLEVRAFGFIGAGSPRCDRSRRTAHTR